MLVSAFEPGPSDCRAKLVSVSPTVYNHPLPTHLYACMVISSLGLTMNVASVSLSTVQVHISVLHCQVFGTLLRHLPNPSPTHL